MLLSHVLKLSTDLKGLNVKMS